MKELPQEVVVSPSLACLKQRQILGSKLWVQKGPDSCTHSDNFFSYVKGMATWREFQKIPESCFVRPDNQFWKALKLTGHLGKDISFNSFNAPYQTSSPQTLLMNFDPRITSYTCAGFLYFLGLSMKSLTIHEWGFFECLIKGHTYGEEEDAGNTFSWVAEFLADIKSIPTYNAHSLFLSAIIYLSDQLCRNLNSLWGIKCAASSRHFASVKIDQSCFGMSSKRFIL